MSLPVPINVAVLASATDLYVAGAAEAQLTTLVLTNTTAGALTISIWKRNAGDTTSWHIAETLPIAAKESLSFKGALVTFSASGEKLRAQASGTGIDAVGSIIEY